MSTIRKLLFIDTNVWLDFYRTKNDSGLKLLEHVEAVTDSLIVSYQLEIEFKKNRHKAIIEGMNELKSPAQVLRPGIFSDAKATKSLKKHIQEAEKRVKKLKTQLIRALDNPNLCDPVYKTSQRIFHRKSSLTLTRECPHRATIRRKAMRRFLHGCPPRKNNDTSIGDAINWEWMIHCAIENSAELVIVTRDSDYGIVFENRPYLNDHLKQEFSERVSKKRKVLLYNKLSEALKHFAIPISNQEEDAENEVLASSLKQNESLIDSLKAFQAFMIQTREALDPIADSSLKIKELFVGQNWKKR